MNPATATRVKTDSSMTVGTEASPTMELETLWYPPVPQGALLSGATLIVKRIRGIRRAALAPCAPDCSWGNTAGGLRSEC